MEHIKLSENSIEEDVLSCLRGVPGLSLPETEKVEEKPEEKEEKEVEVSTPSNDISERLRTRSFREDMENRPEFKGFRSCASAQEALLYPDHFDELPPCVNYNLPLFPANTLPDIASYAGISPELETKISIQKLIKVASERQDDTRHTIHPHSITLNHLRLIERFISQPVCIIKGNDKEDDKNSPKSIFVLTSVLDKWGNPLGIAIMYDKKAGCNIVKSIYGKTSWLLTIANKISQDKSNLIQFNYLRARGVIEKAYEYRERSRNKKFEDENLPENVRDKFLSDKEKDEKRKVDDLKLISHIANVNNMMKGVDVSKHTTLTLPEELTIVNEFADKKIEENNQEARERIERRSIREMRGKSTPQRVELEKPERNTSIKRN